MDTVTFLSSNLIFLPSYIILIWCFVEFFVLLVGRLVDMIL